MTTNFNYDNDFPEHSFDKVPMIRNCSLCMNKPICAAYVSYKQAIEPNIENATEIGLNAENLALHCKLYREKEIRKAEVKRTYQSNRQ